MSNKSLFEKLFEEVMNDDADLAALKGGSGMDSEGGEGEFGGSDEMGSEDVTISMDRETAQKLHDLLASVLGGDVVADQEMESEGEEKGGKVKEGGESYGGSEDAEEEEEEEEEGELQESPQAQYETFETEGKAKTLQGKGNMTVKGAINSKVSGQGEASKKEQTQGTAHYMKMNTSYDDGKSNNKVKSHANPSGAGKSMFQP